ncbi:EamA family transporter [Ahrensia kielensis]|uniref:EamA family transporter n=1 Tax=Ahrensia kielensis TaxID=76980 RepID=A0ABU9T3T0_9HYPH
MPAAQIALAILVAAIYGTAFVAIQYAVLEIPPLMATGYRYVFTALPLIFFIRKPNVAWLHLAAYGIMQAVVMFGIIFTAIRMGMPPGLASMVVQLQVFFTVFFAFALMGEKPTPKQILGAAIAIFGVGIIGWGLGASAPLVPFFMTIASAAAWGIANIISKKAKPNSMLGYVVWSGAFAPLPLFALSSLIEGTNFGILPIWPPSPIVIASILYLAYPTTVLAFTAWVFLLQKHSAAAVTPFALLIPIFGMGSTAIMFGEPLSAITLLGAALVFIGLAVAVIRRRTIRVFKQ